MDRCTSADEAVGGAVADVLLASWVTPAAMTAPMMAAMSNRRATRRLVVV
jgi:hypothetical protein